MSERFDEFARALAGGTSRRQALVRLIGGIGGALLASLAGERSAEARSVQLHSRHGRCTDDTQCTGGQTCCNRVCCDSNLCFSVNGTGGAAQVCVPPSRCSGDRQCPRGATCCGGVCCPGGFCLTVNATRTCFA
jgi:hypothetical protein